MQSCPSLCPPWLALSLRLAPLTCSCDRLPAIRRSIFDSSESLSAFHDLQEVWQMGLALLAIIWLITFFSTYFFVAKTWWLPHGASTAAAFIDNQFALTYVLMGI